MATNSQSSKVVAVQRGAYDSFVQLEGEDAPRNLAELLNDLAPAAGDVVDHFNLAINIADAAKNSNAFGFSPSAQPGRLMYAPSLSDMGFDATAYKLQGIVIAHLRSDAPPTQVEVRLVDAGGELVAGSAKTANVTTANADDIVKSDPFDLAGDAGYAIDMRLTTNGAANVTLVNKALFIRVVKK